MKIFAVGDTVWLIEHKAQTAKKTCIMCYGKKSVRIVLGNTDTVSVPCSFCRLSKDDPEGPRGYTEKTILVEFVRSLIIDEVIIKETHKGTIVTYQSLGKLYHSDALFSTEREAKQKLYELAEKRLLLEDKISIESSCQDIIDSTGGLLSEIERLKRIIQTDSVQKECLKMHVCKPRFEEGEPA